MWYENIFFPGDTFLDTINRFFSYRYIKETFFSKDYFTLNKVNGKEWIESKKGFEYELIRDEQLGKLLEVKEGKKIRFDLLKMILSHFSLLN